jgi:hypothetical protein
VRDRHGNAVAEVVVRWLRPTFGRVDPDSSLSDHDGKVFTQWTIEPLVQDSASVVDYSVTVHIDDARAGEVVPRTIHRRVGIQTPNGSLEGVWIAERWEFFSDDAMTRLIEDVIGHGMSGTLTIAATASGVFDWSWRERYAWWGPDNGTDSYGQFEVNGLTIDARLTGVSSRLECDWGDCDGPLHGRYSWFFDGSRLVITRSNSVDYYRAVGPLRAWSRLTLSRR